MRRHFQYHNLVLQHASPSETLGSLHRSRGPVPVDQVILQLKQLQQGSGREEEEGVG